MLESDIKYQLLFDAIDEGFCIIEVIFDGDQKPADYRFLEVNPAFEKLTGLLNAKGKRMRELAPNHEEYLFEIYGRIALTGQPERFMNRAEQMKQWYNVYAFRINQPENRQVAILFKDMTDRKQAEDELRKSIELYERLNQRLHEVWESEKSQIAMNLHDDLGQKLTAIYLDIAWIKSRIGVQSPGVRKKLSSINTSLNEIIQGIKDVSFSLMPSILFELGIVPAIISHLSKFEAQSGIKCSFKYDPEEIVVEEGLSLVLYRVFQESLTNIARHSQASHTEVNLRILKGNIELSVKDDGIGIDKDKIDSLTSMGIAGIKARVRLVNGSVQFIGEKGSGTIIKATIPLNIGKSRSSSDKGKQR
jgi:PAS domain S-box-containing protein